MSLPRYPEHKDSGVEWLGEIPAHWVVAKTVRYFKIAMGQTILKENLIDDGTWPVFSATDGDHYFGFINEPDVRLDVGDLVIPARGNSIGAVKEVKEPSTTTQTTIYCKNLHKNRVLQRFSYHYMVGSKANLFFFTQTAIPQITVQEVGANPLLLPPIDEQTAIATFLDRETSKIDALIAEQEKLLTLLAEKRQATISHAVTKGLTPEAPMKDSGVAWLGKVPAHWETKRLKQLTNDIKAGPFGSALTKDMYVSAGYKVYGQEQVIPANFEIGDYFINPEKYQELRQYTVSCNDILISCVGTFGKIAIVPSNVVPGIINPRLIRIRVRPEVNPEFFTIVLRSQVVFEQFSLLSRGGTMDVINIGTLSGIVLALPGLAEQSQIVSFLATETARLDALAAEATRGIALLKERRSALISAAVTGKIDVRHLAEAEAA